MPFSVKGLNRNWIIFSAVLHVAIVVGLMVGLPERKKPLMPPPPIIIDLVTVSDKTRTPTFSKKEIITKEVKEIAAPPPPPKAAKAVEKKTEPLKSTMEKKPVENTVKKAEPIKPKPVKSTIKPTPKKLAKAEPKKEPQKKPVKKAELKPAPKKTPEKTPTKIVKKEPPKKAEPKKDFSSLIRKSIDSNKPSPTNGAGQKASAASRELSDVLSVSQMDAVRRHISRCWNIAAIQGARDLDKIEVKTQLAMNSNRTVKSFRVTGGSGQYSPFYGRMVETIERLFQRADCKTLPLPLGQYSQWQQFQLTFSLKDQLGY